MAKNDVRPGTASQKTSYDLVIIGSGPAGVYAAVQAAKLQKTVAIVERDPQKLGGTWIHTGTIPSKTLRETLAAIHSIKFHVGNEWVNRLVEDLSAEKLIGRAHRVAGEEEAIVRKYLGRNKIDLITGYGVIEESQAVRVIPHEGDAYVLHAEKILIATGSKPRRPEEIPFDGWRVVDSDEILQITGVPKKMIVYGAGVIGCEYACIFNAMGADVTIVDGRGQVMQNLDHEITAELRKIMEAYGIHFEMGKAFEKVRVEGPKAYPSFGGQEMECDLFFFAAGRTSNTTKLGLEKLGVKFADRGAIQVNKHFQTNIATIYAAGDAIGMPALAATSAEQGRHATCHAFGNLIADFPEVYPVGIYTIPEMSMVGKTEEELKAANIEYVVGRAYFTEVARGYIRGDNHGLLKILVCKSTHRLLGIHVVGADACNLIHIGLGFMLYNGTVQDIVNRMIFNYPTLAETFRIAAFNALNKIFTDGVIKAPPGFEEEQAVVVKANRKKDAA